MHARNSSSVTLATLWNLLLYKNPAQNPKIDTKTKHPLQEMISINRDFYSTTLSAKNGCCRAGFFPQCKCKCKCGKKAALLACIVWRTQLCLLALCEESSGCLHGELSGRYNEEGGGGEQKKKKKKNRLTEAITHNIRSALVPVSVEVLLERIIPGDSISLSRYCCCFCCCNRMQLQQCQHEHHHYHNKSCSQPPTAATHWTRCHASSLQVTKRSRDGKTKPEKKTQLKQINKNAAKPPPPQQQKQQQQQQPQNQITENVAKPTTPTTTDHQLQAGRSFLC